MDNNILTTLITTMITIITMIVAIDTSDNIECRINWIDDFDNSNSNNYNDNKAKNKCKNIINVDVAIYIKSYTLHQASTNYIATMFTTLNPQNANNMHCVHVVFVDL